MRQRDREDLRTLSGAAIVGASMNHKKIVNNLDARALKLKERRLNRVAQNYTDARTNLADMPGRPGKNARKLAGKVHGKKVSLINRDFNRMHGFVQGKGRMGLISAAPLVGAPLLYSGLRARFPNETVHKNQMTRQDFDALTAGSIAAVTAHQAAGFAGKLAPGVRVTQNKGKKGLKNVRLKPTNSYEKRLRNRISASEDFKRMEREHMERVGLPKDAKPGDPRYVKFFREYPREMPGAKYRRVISHTHGGKHQVMLAGTLAAAGGYGGMRVRDHYVKKSTNIREYPYLPENIREWRENYTDIRRNPISPLESLSAGMLMAQANAAGYGKRLSYRKAKKSGYENVLFFDARRMMYSPIGRGSTNS